MIEKEKAEAYDKALERARAINNGKDVDVESGTTICEYIFPELKESEDEKIKKEIIKTMYVAYTLKMLLLGLKSKVSRILV